MSAHFDADVSTDLLSRARGRDHRALETIYRQFERAVFNLARRMTGCPDAAQDITQDSFIKAFERLPQYRGEAPFGYWLRSIAASESLMHLRAGRRWLELFSPGDVEDLEASVEDATDSDFERALGLLPPVPRSVLWLYHVEGYTHIEIAQMCQRTESFSKSQLARAHQKLRTLLAPAGKPAAAVLTRDSA